MTGGEITKVLYQCVKAMDLPVTGEVYYKGMRPLQNGDDPGKEDIVVAVLTGTAGQIQKGSCVVNVYVPDTQVASGAFLWNKRRTDEIERWLASIPREVTRRSGILFKPSGMIATLAEEKVKEHFVSLKMDFKLLNADY
jgi:hypothetical protein